MKRLLSCFAIALILTAVAIVNYISSNRVDTWLERAKDAGNPAQVAEFLGEYKDGLYQMGRVEGKYYSIFKYPATDMSTYIRVVKGLQERALALSAQQASSESYQMGLINLEKDLGDLDARCFSVWVASGGLFIQIMLVIMWMVATIMACHFWFAND